MKSYHVHYANKYPGGRCSGSENSFDAYDAEGNHCVALRKDGAGQWSDKSEEFGCKDKHDLSPIPKDARYMKLYPDGKIGKSEEHDERKPNAHKYAKENGGKVPSEKELKDAEAKK